MAASDFDRLTRDQLARLRTVEQCTLQELATMFGVRERRVKERLLAEGIDAPAVSRFNRPVRGARTSRPAPRHHMERLIASVREMPSDHPAITHCPAAWQDGTASIWARRMKL